MKTLFYIVLIFIIQNNVFAVPRTFKEKYARRVVKQERDVKKSNKYKRLKQTKIINRSNERKLDDKLIRVCVYKGKKSVNIAVSCSFRILLLPDEKLILKGYFYPARKITSTDDGKILLDGEEYDAEGIYLSTRNAGMVSVNGRRFRGNVKIIFNKKEKTFDVINILSVRSYLKGVLCREISPNWALEAIKAQAIIARTYAWYKIKNPDNKDYDLLSTVYSQVYGGVYSEDSRTNNAVDRTSGLIFLRDGKLFPAFYHAACGGSTEDVEQIWSMKHPSLRAVKCGFCMNSPHYLWSCNFSSGKLSKKLKKHKDALSATIKEIKVLKRSESERAVWIEVVYSGGESIKMSGNTFRLTVGPDIIKSTNFYAKSKDDRIYFSGKGWGHGVGFCQWGAKGLAEKEKMNAVDIVAYYYDKVNFVRIK